MGCCQSSLTPTEKLAFQCILNGIPAQYRQEIFNLPTKRFLKAYENHLVAVIHLQREEYILALLNECQAMKNLEQMLQQHQDHVLFIPMHKLLSVCHWKTNQTKFAIQEGLVALAITLKYMSTDYTEISLQHSRVATFALIEREWKTAERHYIKAIEAARLSNTLQSDYISQMENFLRTTREQINGSPVRILTAVQLIPNPDENREDLLRRAMAELNTDTEQIGTFNIDPSELKRIADKETDLQINDDIFNDVLNNLEKFLTENAPLQRCVAKGGGLCFIAAYFKCKQMSESSLSTAVIESALTRIVNQIDNGSDERYARLKLLPFIISYNDDDDSNIAGVRMFQIEGKKTV